MITWNTWFSIAVTGSQARLGSRMNVEPPPPAVPGQARAPALHFFFFNITQEIQLVGDIDQFPGFDLAVTLGDPGLKAAAVQFGITVQGLADGVDDKVEKKSLIAGITVRAGKDHPVGAARDHQAGARRPEAPEESAPGAATARGPAPATPPVHGAVIQGFDP